MLENCLDLECGETEWKLIICSICTEGVCVHTHFHR